MLDGLPPEVQRSLMMLDLSFGEIPAAPRLQPPLNALLLGGGKRLRPALTFLMAGLVGLPQEDAAPLARASELVHAAFLAHDDVIDDADLRRGQPTFRAAEGNPAAVLTGDLLLGRVVVEVARLGQLDLIQTLAEVVESTVVGELSQLEARGRLDVTPAHLMEVGRRKTGCLFGWSAAAPARRRGAAGSVIALCEGFGEQAGIAYQMIDDTLDFAAHPEKPFAQDLREGLLNFVTLEILSLRPDLAAPLGRLLGDPDPKAWPWDGDLLAEAQGRVRARALGMLEGAGALLRQIYAAGGGEPALALACLRSLEGLLTFFGGRQR